MSILLEAITKHYNDEAILSELSLEIESGELFVLLGASGSGKSTLLRIIAGLTPLDSGRVLLHDRDVTAMPPQQRGIGFVFQNYSLFQHMTVAANVGFALEVQHVNRAERETRVAELLDLIDMRGFADRLPSALSGGQQQRVALARALAHKPSVLLLDEPFGALDVNIRTQLRQDLLSIQQRLNVTAILVTHDQDEAFELADRVGVIERGRLLEVGTSGDLYHAPRHRYTALFLGTANVLRGRLQNDQLTVGDSCWQLPAGDSVLIRPEGLILAPTAATLRERAAHTLGTGTIADIAFAVPLPRVAIDWVNLFGVRQRLIALAEMDELSRDKLHAGDSVWIGFDHGHPLPNSGD